MDVKLSLEAFSPNRVVSVGFLRDTSHAESSFEFESESECAHNLQLPAQMF